MRRPILLAVLCVGLARVAAAQPPSGQAQDIAPITPQRHYNGIVAGEEAYLANDARREAELGRQVNLNADMYWRWSGASSWYPGVFEAWPLVPGEIVGWPAAASLSPPRVSPTNVRSSPLALWAAAPAQSRAAPMVFAPRSQPARSIPAPEATPTRSAAPTGTNHSPGLLPGFVPQGEANASLATEPEAEQKATPARNGLAQPGVGPRAF